MSLKRSLLLAIGAACSATLAGAGTIAFTCDATIDAAVAGTCNTLNTTLAGVFASAFNNANADIYIQYGTTGLGSSTTGFENQVSYTDYLAALTSHSSGNVVDVAALAAMNTFDTGVYSSGMVDIPSALGTALGFTGLTGTTAGGAACAVGTAGCYNGIITITNDPATKLYYRTGPQDPDSYDFYTVVEHEVDEVLGTSSCIETTNPVLTNSCNGSNTPAAVDLYRYISPGSLVLLSSTPGAYFSYDGGATNGTGGAFYNTLSNGDDYADFITGCPANTRVQDGSACPGQNGLNITNDGGAEINILDAVGYNQSQVAALPEPGTMALLGIGFAFCALYRRPS